MALGLMGLTALSGFAIADNNTQNTSVSQNTTLNASTGVNDTNLTIQITNTNTGNVMTGAGNEFLNPGAINRIDKVISRLQKEISVIDILATKYSTAGDTDAAQILTILKTFEQTNILTPIINAQATGNATMILNALKDISNSYPHIPATLTSARLKAQIDEIEKKTQDTKILALLTTASSDLDQVLQLAAEGRKYVQGDLDKVWKQLIPDASKNIQTAALWIGVNAFVDTWTKNLNSFETKNNVTVNATITIPVSNALMVLQNLQNPTAKEIRSDKNAVIKAFNKMRMEFLRERMKNQKNKQKMKQEQNKDKNQLNRDLRNLNKDLKNMKNFRGGRKGSEKNGTETNETYKNDTGEGNANSTNTTG